MVSFDNHVVSWGRVCVCFCVMAVEYGIFLSFLQGFQMFYASTVGIPCRLLYLHTVTLTAFDGVGHVFFSAVSSAFLMSTDHTLIRVVTLGFCEWVGFVEDA